MTTGQRLQQAAEREAALQAAAVRAFESDLRAVYQRVTRQLRGLLGDWQARPKGRARAIQLARVLALRARMREALRAAGYDAAVTRAVTDPLERLAQASLRTSRIGNASAAFAAEALPAIEAWRSLRLGELLGLADDVARVMQRVALEGMLGLRPVGSLVLDIVDAMDLSVRQARTLYDTVVSVFSRQMERASSTGAADELFFYVGPMDAKTRPFCERWVGRVLDRAAIDDLDNGQLGDPFLTGGGYNCRHQWKRVSVLDEELQTLYETGQRAPWVQARVDRQEAA